VTATAIFGTSSYIVHRVALPEATVTFAAPPSNGSPIIGYTVTALTGPATAHGTASPITIEGLERAHAYTFTVTAINSIGSGALSAPSSTFEVP
jgi:hypothetical protein